MQTGRYSILEILDFQNLDQFVVPEIQRDYVWSQSEVKDILESIREGFENKDVPYLGFIYAYNDKDYVYKYFLIDGQQRLTTIVLLLIALYHKIGKRFPEHLIKDEKLKLDYKVRQATHDFVNDFIQYLDKNRDENSFDCKIIQEQIWYHTYYEDDITISNLIKNFIVIYDWISVYDTTQLNLLLKFVENEIQLSYFDIENGRQGEELYIYMNARGRQLVENETLKARFLSKIDDIRDKEYWGKRWEVWQDFFWVNKLSSDTNSDRGFTEFLRMVQIITMCERNSNPDKINQFTLPNSKLNFDLLPKLSEIDKYFEANKYLIENVKLTDFFEKYMQNEKYVLESNKKQIDYFRILPLIKLALLI